MIITVVIAPITSSNFAYKHYIPLERERVCFAIKHPIIKAIFRLQTQSLMANHTSLVVQDNSYVCVKLDFKSFCCLGE